MKKTQTKKCDMNVDELKIKALLEGLEAQNIGEFMRQAKVGDYRNYGKAYCASVRDKIEEHKHIVSNWHFLPKLPEINVEVLIAYKYDKKPIQGYWNGKKWIGSFETRDYMCDGFVSDETLNVPEYIYAWAELPDCPEVPTPF